MITKRKTRFPTPKNVPRCMSFSIHVICSEAFFIIRNSKRDSLNASTAIKSVKALAYRVAEHEAASKQKTAIDQRRTRDSAFLGRVDKNIATFCLLSVSSRPRPHHATVVSSGAWLKDPRFQATTRFAVSVVSVSFPTMFPSASRSRSTASLELELALALSTALDRACACALFTSPCNRRTSSERKYISSLPWWCNASSMAAPVLVSTECTGGLEEKAFARRVVVKTTRETNKREDMFTRSRRDGHTGGRRAVCARKRVWWVLKEQRVEEKRPRDSFDKGLLPVLGQINY